MNPAYSVILFTTASGAGYGLLAWLAVTALTHGRATSWWFAATALGVALALITGGLIASTFHLGRPERAWRAFSEWRSSWLSREGIASLATYLPALLFAAAWLQILPVPGLLAAAATATLIMCIVTVFCTARIYSSLPTIRQWRHPLVDAGYLLWALATGAVALAFLAAVFGLNVPILGWLAFFSLAAAAAGKWLYWRSIDGLIAAHTIEQATGLARFGKVRQWEAPHSSMNFVMKEMGYRVARKHALKLRRYVLGAAVAAAAAILSAAFASAPLQVVLGSLSVVCASIAVLIERWLFFAEAQHVSMLYYGAPAA
jgi:DMSO reductase anchor subunit